MWTAESIGFAVLCSHGRGKKHCKCLQENLKMFTEMSFIATPKCYFCLGTLSLILRAPHLIFIFKFGSSHSPNNIKRCKVFLFFQKTSPVLLLQPLTLLKQLQPLTLLKQMQTLPLLNLMLEMAVWLNRLNLIARR